MKYFILIALASLFAVQSCRPVKAINKAIATKDTVVSIPSKNIEKEPERMDESAKLFIRNNYIDFKSFSAKIKVDVQAKDNVPELTANLRMIKDSVIWLSLQATFLNIEVYRVYIKPDSVILLNKQEKEVQYRSLDYLQEVTQIPFDFTTLQNMLIGNLVFFDEATATSKKNDNELLVSSVSNPFKNLLAFNANNGLLMHSKLDDVDVSRSRTASMSYGDYENIQGRSFANKRQITVTEKNKIDIKMSFKQVEFILNKWSLTKNYQ